MMFAEAMDFLTVESEELPLCWAYRERRDRHEKLPPLHPSPGCEIYTAVHGPVHSSLAASHDASVMRNDYNITCIENQHQCSEPATPVSVAAGYIYHGSSGTLKDK
jgi:hypothetical protein